MSEDIDAEYDFVPVDDSNDDKWYGVPPVGDNPTTAKGNYVLQLLGVFLVELVLWTIYRFISAPYIFPAFSLKFYLAHIIAAPVIHLTPILLWWWYVRKEKGKTREESKNLLDWIVSWLPFKFTRKRLFSGLIIGFTAAIIWRLLQQFTDEMVFGAMGLTAPGTFAFLNGLDSLFLLMTFVMFFIVGPVEELQFRSFLYDQSARVLPNWQAVAFSSILFGCSHIPMALFMYQMPIHDFIWALIGWMSAGAVFGVLYMYSRNIYACIIMHGMGNWQLFVYYFSSSIIESPDSTSMMIAGIISTVIVNIILIVIFFLAHKYFWQPHARGELALGGAIPKLQNMIRDHDENRQPIVKTWAIATVFCVLVMGGWVGAAMALGEIEPPITLDISENDAGGLIAEENLNDTWETKTSFSGSVRGTTLTGGTDTQTFTVEEDVVKVEMTIGWTGGFDLDFTLYDAEGKSVGTGATQDNPEVISVSRVKNPGEWTLEAVAFMSVQQSSYTADIIFTHEGPEAPGNATA